MKLIPTSILKFDFYYSSYNIKLAHIFTHASDKIIVPLPYQRFSIYILCVIGATTIDAYFPKGSKWYEIYTGKVESAAGGATVTLNTPIDYIPVS